MKAIEVNESWTRGGVHIDTTDICGEPVVQVSVYSGNASVSIFPRRAQLGEIISELQSALDAMPAEVPA